MAGYRFSRLAERDLLEIGRYTLLKWGEAQANRYLEMLEAGCERLSRNPGLGRSSESIRPALLRMECGRHVIFYRRTASGILISRILHRQMLPERHALGEPGSEVE